MGLLGIPFPEEEGGAGMDTLAYAIAIEELARVWGSLALIVAAHTSLGCNPLHLAGTTEQKQRCLVPMAQGQVLGAYGLTEPRPAPIRAARARRRATRTVRRRHVGDQRRQALHHQRRPGRHVHRHRAHRRRAAGSPEISAFIVPADTPGFVVGRLEEKLGLHARATGELLFEAAACRPASCSASRGRAGRFLQTLDGGRISIGAMAVGLAQAALDAAVAYARSGSSSGDRSAPSRASPSWSPTWRPRSKRHGRWSGARRGSRTRAATTRLRPRRPSCSPRRSAQRATNTAVQVHGGYGYVEEYKVERYLRDAKLTEIGEGTSQIQRLVIARRILDLRVF